MAIKKRYGFTLGEVLLAVLIIGIISLLTLPSLIKNMNAKSRMELLKNTIANVGTSIQQEFTKYRTTNITDTDIYNNPKAFLENFDYAQSGVPFASSYGRHTNTGTAATIVIPADGQENQAAILLKNGVGIGIVNNEETSTTSVIVDLTGDKKPNKVGADYFVFKIEWNDDYSKGIRAGDINSFENGGATGTETNESLTTACKNGNGAACFRLVDLSNYDPNYLK